MLSAQSYSNGFNLHHLWHEPSFLYRDQNPTSQSTNRQGHEAEDSHQGRAGRNHEDNKSNPPMNVYTILRQEENALETRKQNLQRFGAGWIRVPGNPKTYQQMIDEHAEREEIELQAQREQAALDAQAAMEHQQRLEQQVAQTGMETEQGQGAGEEGERDLDNEIPDAASLGNDDDWNDDDEDELPQQEGNGDYAGIVTPAQTHAQPVVRRTRSSLFMHRNLDSDMPDEDGDASEYEHTDTDMESESSEDEAIRSQVRMRQMLPSTSARESLVEQDGSIFGGGSLRESVGNVSLQTGGLSMHGRVSLPSSLLDSSPLAPSRRGGRRR